MLDRIKQKIYNGIFRRSKQVKLSKREIYQSEKYKLEQLLSLQNHDSWEAYENMLMDKLYFAYKTLKFAKGDEVAYYQGCIYELESILILPKAVEEREEYLRLRLLEKDGNKDNAGIRKTVSGVVSV